MRGVLRRFARGDALPRDRAWREGIQRMARSSDGACARGAGHGFDQRDAENAVRRNADVQTERIWFLRYVVRKPEDRAARFLARAPSTRSERRSRADCAGPETFLPENVQQLSHDPWP